MVINARSLYMRHIPMIVIKTAPERSVFVAKNYAAGSLKLVMAPPNASHVKEVKKEGSSKGVIPHGSFQIKGEVDGKMFVSPYTSKDLVIPAWWCRITKSKSEATMDVTWIAEKGIEFPCLVNSVALKRGDEVVRFLKPQEKEKTINRVLNFEPSAPSKRPRTS